MTFAKYVLNRFFSLAAQNDKAYVELLFWKNTRAVNEMTEGYSKEGLVLFVLYVVNVCVCVLLCSVKLTIASYFSKYFREKKPTWTEEEEEELRKLYEEHHQSDGEF